QQDASIDVVDTSHPAMAGLPMRWNRFDEWYNFRTNPSNVVDVLARLDETTYNGGTMDGDHPIVWSHEYDGGRAFYTAGGHTSASYREPAFVGHLRGGILWAAGRAP
ncbi:MAG: ThuA domain-containing protein, partial [Myxococcota bacterium]